MNVMYMNKLGERSKTAKIGFFPVDEDYGNPAPLEQVEKNYLDNLMGYVMGNITQAARLSGLSRATLYRKLEDYLKKNNRKHK